jgi:uncharacterized membrane protein YedE/YeeE
MVMGVICKYDRRLPMRYLTEGSHIAEPVMKPVMAILIGGVLIAAGIIFASILAPGIGIVLGVGGVATVLVGIAMLFGLAHQKTPT